MIEYHQEHEKMFLNLLRDKPIYFKHIKPEFFENETLDDFYSLLKEHYDEYKIFPLKNEISIKLKTNNYDHIPNSYIDILDKNNNYSEEYAEEEIKRWIKYRSLKINLVRAAEFAQASKFDNQDPDYLLSKIRLMLNDSPDFSDDLGLDFYNPSDHEILYEDKVSSGYDFFDKLTGGGYDPQTLVVYVGPPNIGKSIYLANDASKFAQQGKNVLFISAEMSAKKSLKRIGAMTLDIPLADYDKLSKDIDFMQNKINIFKNSNFVEPGKLKVVKVPTSKCSVNDIEAIIKRLEEKEGIKFDCLVVDYINILADSRGGKGKGDDSYYKIKNISEDLRALADIKDMLIITATQTRRDGFNAAESITMEHIAESAALSHTADVMWAIIQTTSMYANSYYKLKLLKARDSEGKHTICRIDIDPKTLKLTEVPDSAYSSADDYIGVE